MTVLLITGLIFMVIALVMIFLAGKEDILAIALIGLFVGAVGIFFLCCDSGEKHEGYASPSCETGTYRLSTVDTSNDKNVYITVRDYKDYALRLCSVARENVHSNALKSKNVRVTYDNEKNLGPQLYPAE
jgi:cell division protein FtsW (lipid II flippase)